MSSCAKHPHERGVSPCRRCGAAWCGDCLVYAFGGAKLPYCMSCAMFAGGVRTAAARPALGKREMKQLLKAHKADARAASNGPQPEGAPEPTAGDGADVDVVAEPTTDWEKPWWEDRQPSYVE